MTDNITIPSEALEAAARAIATMEGVPEAWVLRQVRARAACLAMIRAWPGMLTMPATPDGQWTPWATTSAHIILPLPTEKETSA